MFDATGLAAYERPILATSTDGVGTKVAIAQALGRHDTIGFDLVGMVVDDIVVCGAEPLFMTDYIACGKVVPERIAAIVSGIAAACQQAGVALIGGETAEHPGLLGPDEYDVAGSRDRRRSSTPASSDRTAWCRATWCWPWRAAACTPTATPSCGGWWRVPAGGLDRHVDEFGRTLGEEPRADPGVPADLLDLVGTDDVDVHALSHVTGVAWRRTWPGSSRRTHARLDRSTWTPPPSSRPSPGWARSRADLERTLNMGVGFVAVVPSAESTRRRRCWRRAASTRG